MPRKPISFELDFMIKDIFPRFTVKQFDDVSFNIKPLNQGLEYDTSNMIGKIFVGVNNDMFMQTTDITVSSDNINVLLDKNMLQKNGRAYAEIELTDEAGTITSSSFIFDIDPKIGEGGMIPGEYEGFVEKYERLISEFKAQINSSIDNSNNLIDKTIKNCNTSVDTKLSTVDSRLNSKVAEVDNKLNTVDGLITAKVSDFEKRFNRLTSSQQQDSEVIDAREGEVSLKARLDKDIENPKQLYTSIEDTEISVDSLEGYLKDIEILGNTVQDQDNLADIRSVGDKLENQELYEIPVLCTNGLDSSDSNYKEHKLTILSPKTLKSYNGTKDRIVCKNNVWVHEENVTYDAEGNGTVLSTPIDTPLPYDQQVKLRTFANKTNIHFECEIEPTLKASVPKSLGASVSSNTTQIYNLSKELEKINNLEESVTSEVVSESDFITVENTNSGYFSDIKLEGKTLILNADNEVVEAGTEGATLKSVGQDVDEISVLSTNKNLFNSSLYKGVLATGTGEESVGTRYAISDYFICPYDSIYFSGDYAKQRVILHYDKNKNYLGFTLVMDDSYYNQPTNSYYARIRLDINGTETFDIDANFKINVSKNNIEYQPHQSNKKRILYYNDETQTWEKPILRQWDSIEKHNDGKYYYYKRSEEVVLNGSEKWNISSSWISNGETLGFYLTDKTSSGEGIICDKFNIARSISSKDIEGINFPSNAWLGIRILKAKLSTQDLAGLKQWLQTNPTTVVYQLAEEKVYECTNLDLITYADETNLLVKSGVLNPKVTLKVKKGIGNVVTMLQNKVAMLEELVNKLIQK